MKAGREEQDPGKAFRQEVKLHINERLYETGTISKEVYEEAKLRIVADRKQRGRRKNLSEGE